jgi:lipoate-protein ligase A
MRPSGGYVGLGYHHSTDEVDETYCGTAGLPIYRRMVGGGPVYLDPDQLFFQICLPAAAVSPSRTTAIRELLTPAVAAFRAAGVPADLDGHPEITVGDAKICGHGAGQIEDAVVVCGNVIQRFDHDRAARILRLPDETMRAETIRLMRRYITATPLDTATFTSSFVDALSRALSLPTKDGELTSLERMKLSEVDELLSSPDWTGEHGGRLGGRLRQVKIRAGVWVFAVEWDGTRVVGSVRDGALDRVWLAAIGAQARAAEGALAGVTLRDAPAVLERFGAPGRRWAAALATADARRLL